jgi:hypothetical protein
VTCVEGAVCAPEDVDVKLGHSYYLASFDRLRTNGF